MSHEHTDARPALSVPPLRLLSGAAALRDELEHTLAAAEGLHDAAEALTRELLQGRALQPGPTLERARAARRSLSRAGRWLGSAQACAQRLSTLPAPFAALPPARAEGLLRLADAVALAAALPPQHARLQRALQRGADAAAEAALRGTPLRPALAELASLHARLHPLPGAQAAAEQLACAVEELLGG